MAIMKTQSKNPAKPKGRAIAHDVAQVKKAPENGLPSQLKNGIEHLSGYSMDDVRVHYNSSKPASIQAHAYAQNNQIHLAAGQEKHLSHEAWHVVQQKQGRVKPTIQMMGLAINDDISLEKEADTMGQKATQVGAKRDVTTQMMVVNSNNEALQRAAIEILPKQYYSVFEPKYKVWRDQYLLARKTVWGKYTISEIMDKLEKTDDTHLGDDGDHQQNNSSFGDELDDLKDYRDAAIDYKDEDQESLQALGAMQTYIKALDTFLDKWEDTYGQAEIAEKDKLTEMLVKVTTNEDLEIYFFDDTNYDSKTDQYKDALKKKILGDKRLIATLRGKDSFKLHLRDDDPSEISAAIDRAVGKLRDDYHLDNRIKPNGDKEWKDWRKLDCVFAAIIYVMNNDTAKFNTTLGDSPQNLGAEGSEHTAAKGIADKLGVGYNVVDDPVLFSLMKRLGWAYTANQTWNSWVGGNKYDGSATYVISYSRSKKGDSNHTVVFKNGTIYDRQGERLGGAVDLEPTYKDQPMEIWKVDTAAASKVLK